MTDCIVIRKDPDGNWPAYALVAMRRGDPFLNSLALDDLAAHALAREEERSLPCIHRVQGHTGKHWVYPNGETDKAYLCPGSYSVPIEMSYGSEG